LFWQSKRRLRGTSHVQHQIRPGCLTLSITTASYNLTKYFTHDLHIQRFVAPKSRQMSKLVALFPSEFIFLRVSAGWRIVRSVGCSSHSIYHNSVILGGCTHFSIQSPSFVAPTSELFIAFHLPLLLNLIGTRYDP